MRLNVDYKDLDDLLEKYQDTLPPGEKLTRVDVKIFKSIFFGLAEISAKEQVVEGVIRDENC